MLEDTLDWTSYFLSRNSNHGRFDRNFYQPDNGNDDNDDEDDQENSGIVSSQAQKLYQNYN